MDDTGKMPLLFIGHGSPMNAIEDTPIQRGWRELGQRLPRPRAILAISAHFQTMEPKVSTLSRCRQIYDMYGFPEELYQVEYHPPGEPSVARRALELLGGAATEDRQWGIDHGIWSVLLHLYPQADIPVVMMSTGLARTPEDQVEIGRRLRPLREEGVLLLGSGNVVHNLSRIDRHHPGGYDWALRFDRDIRQAITRRQYDPVIGFRQHPDASRAFRTAEHFYPLLNILGAADEGDTVTVWNEGCTLGSLSMTSYLFEPTHPEHT